MGWTGKHFRDNVEDFLRLYREGPYKAEAFDESYARYAEEHARSAASIHEQEWLAEQLEGRNRPLSILDVGCNTGVPLAAVCEMLPGTQGTGCDINPVAIRLASTRRGWMFRWSTFDGLSLPYHAGQFNHVMFHHAIAHVEQPHRLLLEIRRVLRPGGSLSIITSNAKYKFWQTPANILKDRKPDTTVLRHYSREQLVQLLQNTGFEATHVELAGPLPTVCPPWFRASRRLRLLVYAHRTRD